MSPALPESPEVIVGGNYSLPTVPVNGTRPGQALGLALGPSLSVRVPTGLPTPPLVDSPTADSPHSWTSTSIHSDSPQLLTVPKPIHAQPLPPLPPCRPRPLGRQLPHTLTESLELLVRVQEHCNKLGASGSSLGAVPEEPLPASFPSRRRRCSIPAPPPPAIRQVADLAYASCINLHTAPPATSVGPSVEPPGAVRPATAPAQLQRTQLQRALSASSDSSSSGDWPETPQSVFAGAVGKSEAATMFSSGDDLARPAMRSVIALDQQPLSVATLAYAAELELLDEAGRPLRFGDVLSTERTLVVFVRHWLSPSCATYLRELMAELTPIVLARSHARVVLIGHGAANMISGFRQHLQCPFPVYTDPSRKLHHVLGLVPKGSKGSHLGRARDLFMGAARMGLRSGNRSQMGGLFVFDGLDVSFTHRMRGDGDHAPIPLVLEGVLQRAVPHLPVPSKSKAPKSHRHSVYGSPPGHTTSTSQSRGAQSCTTLVEPPQRLVFPLPPNSSSKREDLRRKRLSMPRDGIPLFLDDIAPASCEMRGMRV